MIVLLFLGLWCLRDWAMCIATVYCIMRNLFCCWRRVQGPCRSVSNRSVVRYQRSSILYTLPPPPPSGMAQIEAKSWGVGLTVPEGRRGVNLDESVLRMLEPAQHRRNPIQSSYHSFKCECCAALNHESLKLNLRRQL